MVDGVRILAAGGGDEAGTLDGVVSIAGTDLVDGMLGLAKLPVVVAVEEVHLPTGGVAHLTGVDAQVADRVTGPQLIEAATRSIVNFQGEVRRRAELLLVPVEAKLAVANADVHAADTHLIGPNPLGNGLCKGEEMPVGLLPVRYIMDGRAGVSIALRWGLHELRDDRTVVDAAGELPYQKPMRLHAVIEHVRGELRECTDGMNAQAMQLRGRRVADIEEILHGERPHLMLDFRWPECMHLIRLPEVGGHLREQLVTRDADVHRKAELLPDPLLQLPGQQHRPVLDFTLPRGVDLRRQPDRIEGPDAVRECARHIEEGLVDAVLLDGVRVLLQDFDHRPARVTVERVVRRDDDELRALPPRIHDGLAGLNMIFLRRNRLREDDPVALTLVAAHRARNRTKIQRAAEMVNPIARLPAEKCRIHIDMKDNPLHNPTS